MISIIGVEDVICHLIADKVNEPKALINQRRVINIYLNLHDAVKKSGTFIFCLYMKCEVIRQVNTYASL